MFTHLHVHTEYSLLDGLSRIEPLVHRARELGMDSLAITDHGGLYGAIDFYRAARGAGIKPIIGCEMYVAPGSRHGRTGQEKSPYHLTVLAKDLQGYRNLVKLVTASHLEGYYYKPRVDRELLERHHEGLIVLSGCPSGEVPRLISQGRLEEAQAAATWYRELFPEYHLELMEHGGVEELPAINQGLMEIHRGLGIPVVATNDSHYVHQRDAALQDILICIHTNTNVNDPKRLRMEEDSYYLKDPQEMAALYADLPEAVANSQAIAELCNLELDFSQVHMPQYPVPDGLTADAFLARLCEEGLARRVASAGARERERLAYELKVIRETMYADYFLVVWDIGRFVRGNDINLAVRGSAAASLVLYCLGVTDVNPLTYGLVFERFLNVERKEMPDIDLDIQDDRREEVLSYVVSKYGSDNVAQIITFGTLGARASVRDVGRALAMPYAEVDRIARLIPTRLHITLDDALKESHELPEVYEADEEVRRLIDTARGLEGLTRHSSTHAAGVVISDEPLDSYVPLQRPSKGDEHGMATTQYAMEPIAAIGLLKMDFLGLVNLTILAKARELISSTRGVDLTLTSIPLDDAKTFEMLSKGDTVGVFQLEGSGMTRYVQELKPSSLADVAAMIALYRPGPMEHITTFIEAKHGRRGPQYPHPKLRDILQETYGVIVYQDQVLLIAQAFAGYSLGEADIVRKAMGKKIPEIMAQERERFIDGALDQGYTKELSEQVFALVEPFAGYAFNKAHAFSYGLISYCTAYLKANYPVEYMVCLLNGFADNLDKVSGTVVECGRLEIPVLRPDVNKSQAEYAIEVQDDGAKAIRIGLASIKNVGSQAVLPIIMSREAEGPFTSMEHMCRAADMGAFNRKPLEALIKTGAFDDFGDRGALLSVMDRILSLSQSEAQLRDSNQASMFDMFGESVPTPLSHIELPDGETPESERKAWEIELLGVRLSGTSLLDLASADVGGEAIISRRQIGPELDGRKIILRGEVASVTERTTRQNKPYAIINLSLFNGNIDVFAWDNVLRLTEGLWQQGNLVSIVGAVKVRDERVSISCLEASEFKVPAAAQEAPSDTTGEASLDWTPAPTAQVAAPGGDRPPEPAAARHGTNGAANATMDRPPAADPHSGPRRLTLRIRETGQVSEDQRLLDDAKKLLLEYRGEDEVNLEVAMDERVVSLEWPLVRAKICPELEAGLRTILGDAGNVVVESTAS